MGKPDWNSLVKFDICHLICSYVILKYKARKKTIHKLNMQKGIYLNHLYTHTSMYRTDLDVHQIYACVYLHKHTLADTCKFYTFCIQLLSFECRPFWRRHEKKQSHVLLFSFLRHWNVTRRTSKKSCDLPRNDEKISASPSIFNTSQRI